MLNIDFADYIEKTNASSDADTAFQHLEKSLSSIGIDKVLYSLMTDFSDLNQKAGHGIFRNYPDDWMSYYVENSYEDVDPVRQYLMRSDQAFEWDTLDKRMPLTKQQLKLMNQASETGLTKGIGLGIHCSKHEVVGMGFASTENIKVSKTHLSWIQALSQQFHTVYTALNTTQNNEYICLSARQKEILCWTAEGKSAIDIADILGISDRTVRQHREVICKKLNCYNMVVAVTKAIHKNIITPASLSVCIQ